MTRPFFKFGEDVVCDDDMEPWQYIAPLGTGPDHIVYNLKERKAYRTSRIENYHRPRPVKFETWEGQGTGTRVAILDSDPNWVVFTRHFQSTAGGNITVHDPNVGHAMRADQFARVYRKARP